MYRFVMAALVLGAGFFACDPGGDDPISSAKTVATGVSLNKSATTILVGETETLTATIAPGGATNKTVTWASSDESKATVDNEGVVTGVAVGTATITVTTEDGGFTATCAVTIVFLFTDSPSYDVTGVPNEAIPTVDVSDGVRGGTAPYNFSSGDLPEGLSIDSSTGVISGTVASATSTTATITVTDSATPTAHTAQITIAVTISNVGINRPAVESGKVEQPVAGGTIFYGTGAVFTATIDGNAPNAVTWTVTGTALTPERSSTAAPVA
jgi:hypothetical protein